MAFQFTCPQGHLLEAEPTAAGQQCNCPHCGMLFIIPAAPAYAVPPAPTMYAAPAPYAPAPSAPAPYAQPGYAPAPHAPAAFAGPAVSAPASLPHVGPTFASGAIATTPVESAPVAVEAAQPAAPELLHIPCPNGHELDTPRDMLDQEVLCPHCGEQFLLREKDSVEYKRKKQQEAELKDYKRGKAWLNWAIVFAVAVLIGLVALIFATSG